MYRFQLYTSSVLIFNKIDYAFKEGEIQVFSVCNNSREFIRLFSNCVLMKTDPVATFVLRLSTLI